MSAPAEHNTSEQLKEVLKDLFDTVQLVSSAIKSSAGLKKGPPRPSFDAGNALTLGEFVRRCEANDNELLSSPYSNYTLNLRLEEKPFGVLFRLGHLMPGQSIKRWSDDENCAGWNTIDLRRIDRVGMGVKFPHVFTLTSLYEQCKKWIDIDPARAEAVMMISYHYVSANCWFGLVEDEDIEFRLVPTYNPAHKIGPILDEINRDEGSVINPNDMSPQYAKLLAAVKYWEVLLTTQIYLLGGKLWTLDSMTNYVTDKLADRLTTEEDRQAVNEQLQKVVAFKNADLPGVEDAKHHFVICRAASIERIIDAVVATLFS